MRSRPTLGWGLVAVAVFGWHLLWWGLIKPQDIPEPLSSKASNIRYLPVPNDDKDPRLKEILAPLIFSTPSIAGFSQPLLEKEAESVPPLRVVRDLSIKLDREPSGVTREHTVSSSDFQSEVKKQLDEFIFVMPEEDPYRAQQPVNGIELKWEGDLDQERIKYAEANPDWLAITNTSWEAVVHLRFDKRGEAIQVMVDGESSPDVRKSVVHWAWHLRTESAETVRRSRLIVRVQP